MNFLKRSGSVAIISIALCLLNGSLHAQTSAFTYQGRLVQSGVPQNGMFDFEFRLCDAVNGGAVLASQQSLNVQVIDGTFNVSLDFGAGAFPGPSRYLEIALRSSGAPAFTTMLPRQEVLSTPYAIKSLTATSADNSSSLGGVAASRFVQQDATGNVSIAGNLTVTGSATYANVNALGQYELRGSPILSAWGIGNLFVGVGAGIVNTTGYDNSFFGAESGEANTTGFENSFFGKSAGLRNTTGGDNVFVGINAGINNTTGDKNTFIGAAAGTGNTSGTGNTIVGYLAGLNSNGSGNAFFGYSSGGANTSGGGNSYFGTNSGLLNTTGSGGAFFGSSAGQANTTGIANAFFGASSGAFNTTGSRNTFIGTNAGSGNQVGSNSTIVGFSAGLANAASDNSFFGALAGQNNTTGDLNAFFGVNAGLNNSTGCCNSFFGNNAGSANTTGRSNAFFGGLTGGANTTGNKNAFFGDFTGSSLASGDGNTFVGAYTGLNVSAGSFNTVLGTNVAVGNNLTNASAIGANASVTANNSIVLGSINGVNGATADTNVGIGTTAPLTRFQVRTGTGSYGITHTDGTISVGSYVGSSSSGAFGGWLGTQSNHKLFFFTNNGQPSLTVDTTGNIGIGTPAPTSKLTVTGVVESTAGGIKFPDGTTQATAAVIPGSLVNTVNSLTGNVALAGGSNITITPTGNTLTIASTVNTTSVNGLTGNVTLAAGSNITITPAGNTLTIASTGGGSANAILNQTIQQADANFNISGTGRADTFTAGTQYNIGGNRIIGTPGQNNLFIGVGAGAVTPSPGDNNLENTFVGRSAGANNVDCCNAFFGNYSGQHNTTGGGNTYLGYQAGVNATTGSNNTFVGLNSGSSFISGNGNTFVGNIAGNLATSGTNNTFLGQNANFAFGVNNLSFATAIGAGSVVDTSNTVVLGKAAIGSFPADTVRIPGNLVVSGTTSTPSDARLKQNIQNMSYGLSEVLRLRPVSWRWKAQPDGKPVFGMIAQEVEPIMPELVTRGEDASQSLTMSYMGFLPVMVKAIQEQEDVIKKQQSEIDALKQLVCADHPKAEVCK